MPDITLQEYKKIMEHFKESMKTLTLYFSADNENKALKECDEYLNGTIQDVINLSPLSIYYILSKISPLEQIEFIKKNITYLKQHDEDIFLYNLEAPKELVYYFSYDVLEQIHNIDEELFEKIMQGNMENIFYSFTHEEYLLFFENFKSYIECMKSYNLFNVLYLHNRCLFDKFSVDQLKTFMEIQPKYNQEFMSYFIENFSNKIKSFKPRELLSFISYIEDIQEYERWVLNNKKKLKLAFKRIKDYDLKEYLCEHTNKEKQEILFANFLEEIASKQDIRKIISNISSKVIIDLYNTNKEVFDKMTLDDWIKLCAKKREFNEEFQRILDSYEINNISQLLDIKFYTDLWENHDITSLKYIEKKYRDSLTSTSIIPVQKISSIFSEEYLNNLKYLQIGLKNKSLSKNSKEYEENLAKFIMYLKSNNIVLDFNDINFKEVNTFFYKIVMGYSVSNLFKIESIEDITIINRLGKKEFNVSCFTVEQLEKFNVKELNQLIVPFNIHIFNKAIYKQLILKLIFLVGFHHAKKILEIDHEMPTLEHLVGNVNVKNIGFDELNRPILNNKILNLLFSHPERIKEIFSDKDNDIYKYFPRIFNEWELIKLNGKDTSLTTVLDFLKSDEITLPPNYYRLDGLFKFIGCASNIVQETLALYDEILKRTTSTIPKIKKQIGEYSYEVLDLQDMEGLTVGNKTDCCFIILNTGYPCLKHAMTSLNGRILVVKKNEELIAHSWLWRNGNLLCLDNIEVSKSIKEIDFLNVYIDFANEIINKSFENEGTTQCIKNVTIGYTNFDKSTIGLQAFPCFVYTNCDLETKEFGKRIGKNRKMVSELPHPIENVKYFDAKNVQYLIKGNGKFEYYQSNYLYRDERTSILHYENNSEYSEEYINTLNKIVNSLRYTRLLLSNEFTSFHPIDIRDYKSVICNHDWFIIENDEEVDSFIYSNDERAFEEMKLCKSENLELKKIAI